jgi:hypothetical protein
MSVVVWLKLQLRHHVVVGSLMTTVWLDDSSMVRPQLVVDDETIVVAGVTPHQSD